MQARRSRLLRAVAAIGASSLIAASVIAAATVSASAKTEGRGISGTLEGSVPGWVAKARNLGVANRRGGVDFDVLLPMRNMAGLEATVRAVSTPGNRGYTHYLTDAQFRARYAPAASSVQTVQRWLRSQGFKIESTLASGMYVEATGTVAQAEHAFGTTLHSYRYEGKTLRAPTTNLRVPAGIAADVAGVVGLDDTALLTRPQAEPPPPGARYGVQPCSKYYGQKIATTKPKAYGQHEPYVVCGYSSAQFRDAYGFGPLVASGTNGSGVTVAITDAYAAETMPSDANTYFSLHGIPTFAPGQFKQVTPSKPYNLQKLCGNWGDEETLDIESVHGVAPGANVVFVGARNCGLGLDNAWAQTIDKHRADIITNSWLFGVPDQFTPPADVTFFNDFALEAAATGITVSFSSGDSGGYFGGQPAVSMPASDPYLTGVGGTSIAISKFNKYEFEHGWENAYSTLKNGHWSPKPPGPFSSGGGGGTSQLFTQPWYQVGKVPTSISEQYSTTPYRAVPDVAAVGDPNTGMTIGETQRFPNGTYYDQYRLGGTSLSSPVFAGIMAITNQGAGHMAGFVNPALYDMIGTNAVHDIVPPSSPIAEVRTDYANFLDSSAGYLFRLRTMDVQTTVIHSGPGYDDETGVGSPNGMNFIKAFAQG